MEISDFKIRQVIIEIRYEDSYILWDRAGAICSDLTKIWPKLKLTEGAPNQQSLSSEEVNIKTGLNSSHVVLIRPNNITQSSAQIEETIRVWVAALDIKKFTRIGTRVIYFKTFDSDAAAQKAIMDLGLTRYPEPPFFNHKSPPRSSQVTLLWQDDSFQTQFIVKSEHQRLEVSGFMDESNEKQVKTTDVMLIDIDRATNDSVDVAKFRAGDWLDGVRHLISRDAKEILSLKK